MNARFLSRYALELIEALDRVDTSISGRLLARLPDRLAGHMRTVQDNQDPYASLSLDEAEDLFLAIDSCVGDGSGRTLENAAFVVATRVLSHRAGVLVPGDLVRTLHRLRAPLEHPFVGATFNYSITENELGFELQIGITRRPRATRLLRHLAVGYIKAAHTFVGGQKSSQQELRIYADTRGDKANLTARFKLPSIAPPPMSGVADPLPRPRRAPSQSRLPALSAVPSLADEVERIMESVPPPRRSTQRMRRVSSSQMPAVRPSAPLSELPPAEDKPPANLDSGNYRVDGRYRYRESSEPPATIDDVNPRRKR